MLTLAPVVLITGQPLHIAVNFLRHDDAYYYLSVARHLAENHAAFFSAAVETNGYQPLWQWLLATCWWLLHPTIIEGLRLQLALVAAVVVIASLQLYRSNISPRLRTALLFALWLTLWRFPVVFLGGMEPVLFLLSIPFLLCASTAKPGWKTGALFFLLFLVRLDALALFLSWALLQILLHQRPVSRAIEILRSPAMLVLIAGVITYALANVYGYGIAVPVSGLNKSLGSRLGENWPVALQYLSFARPALVAVVLTSLLRKIFPGSIEEEHHLQHAVHWLALTSIICACYYGLLSGWPVWIWYLWPVALLNMFAVAQLLLASVALLQQRTATGFQTPSATAVQILLAGAMLAITGLSIVGFRNEALHAVNFKTENIRFIEQTLPQLSPGVIAMGDRAGVLGYAAPDNFPVLQTEGLVLDKAYLQARRDHRVEQYLQAHQVRYLLVDREQLLHNAAGIIGVVEHIQADSLHDGITLLCFPPSAILDHQQYGIDQRILFSFAARTPCPDDLQQQVTQLAARYSGIRYASAPSEFAGGVNRFLLRWSAWLAH